MYASELNVKSKKVFFPYQCLKKDCTMYVAYIQAFIQKESAYSICNSVVDTKQNYLYRYENVCFREV